MPIIDFQSDLAFAARRVKQGLNEAAISRDDAAKLLSYLTSSEGLLFAAKQTMLDPKTATKRLAGIYKQATLNLTPFGLGGNAQSVFSDYPQVVANPTPRTESHYVYGKIINQQLEDKFKSGQTQAEGASTPSKDRSTYPNSVETKYYVKSKVSKQIIYNGETDQGILTGMDIVPFYFTALTTDGSVEPDYHLAFRSFFNSITDNTSGGYASYNFVGRGESFYTYQTYGRTSTFSFKVAALTEDELLVMHNKVEVLRKLAAPKYSSQGYMQGNFINLTIGNLFKDLPGIVTSVTVSTQQNVPWEVGDRTKILPHVLDINVGFTILESSTPKHLSTEINKTTLEDE